MLGFNSFDASPISALSGKKSEGAIIKESISVRAMDEAESQIGERLEEQANIKDKLYVRKDWELVNTSSNVTWNNI